MGRPTVYGKDDGSIHFQEKKSRENPLKRNFHQKNQVLITQISTNKKPTTFLQNQAALNLTIAFTSLGFQQEADLPLHLPFPVEQKSQAIQPNSQEPYRDQKDTS